MDTGSASRAQAGGVSERPGAISVYGVDFTSAPRPGKPLAVARCEFSDGLLTLTDFESLTSFAPLENLLDATGPGVFGLDFPFSQSVKLVQGPVPLLPGLTWPVTWEQLARRVAVMTKAEFEAALDRYKSGRAKGDKHHRRLADTLTRAQSPQTMYGVPVGKMFYQGVRILLRTGCSLVPVRMTGSDRLVFEAYPGVLVRKLVGAVSYKGEGRDTAPRRDQRGRILAALADSGLEAYGLSVAFSPAQTRDMLSNGSGDLLDALLCAVQAAWAWSKRRVNYGLPENVDPKVLAFEGWIMDPHCRQV